MTNPVLILEDNLMLNMMLEDVLNSIDIDDIVSTSSIEAAFSAIEGTELAYAFLDLNIGDETSIDVAKKLSDLNIPFSFTTGAEEKVTEPELKNVNTIQKPFSAKELKAALIQDGVIAS